MFIKMNQRGFTLVEIMIVVAIIGLLAAIAIPNLLRARMNANEGAVRSDLRTFSSAAESYRAAQSTPAYPSTIANLTGASPAYLDSSWTGAKHGFTFTYTPATSTYALVAAPSTAGTTATNTYCIDQSGVIVMTSGGTAPTGATTGCSGGVAIS